MAQVSPFKDRPLLVKFLHARYAGIPRDDLRAALFRAEENVGVWQKADEQVSVRMLADYSWESRTS